MKARAYAVILAGGDGERLWPLSTPERPKQFVSLFGGKALIRHAADRLKGVVPPERTFVVTARRLVAETRRTLPHIPAGNIVGEPCRRDTAAAVAVACGLVKRHGGDDAVGCILTADHLMTPERGFRQTLRDAITAASKSSAIVTIGIEPDRPASEFGYIECAGDEKTGTRTKFRKVKRFVEKPDAKTAARYLKTGGFWWNSGMFIWKVGTLERVFGATAPETGALIGKVARAKNAGAVLSKAYAALRPISFDYAVMEKTRDIIVAKGGFKWDDVGSWTSVANHFPKDIRGNVSVGDTAFLDVSGSIVLGSDNHVIALVGVDDLVVVHTDKATLVCAKNRVQDMKKLLASHAAVLSSAPVFRPRH